MKTSKLIMSYLLALIVLLLSVTSTFAVDVVDIDNKISEELLDIISTNKNDTISVCIYLNNCDKNIVNKRLNEKYKYNVEAYENKRVYYNEVVPNIIIDNKTIAVTVEGEKITPQILSLDNSNSSLDIETRMKINRAMTEDVNKFLRCYREEISSVVGTYVSDFVENNIELFAKIIFQPKYGEFVIAEVSAQNVYNLSKLSEVCRIDYFENVEYQNCSWNANSVVQSDDNIGLGSNLYNDGTGYDGTGIKIGVIEAEYSRYDETNYNLLDANISYVDAPAVSERIIKAYHPTKVCSLICGRKTIIDGKTYGGAAAGATVYQTGIDNLVELLSAIEKFSSMGVNVINFSGGEQTGTGYDYDAQCVDNILHNTRVSFVVSAGNNDNGITDVHTPGKSYNAITVGNAITKLGNEARDFITVAVASSYEEDSYCANKPDVVAPGTYIYWPVSESEVFLLGHGTSYSAPIVTAVVAQIMQSDCLAIFNPNAAKNYIICGSSNENIDGTTVSYGELMDESGAGLVNAVRSYECSNYGTEYYGVYSASQTAPTEYKTVATYNLKKGESIRVALTFEKEENILLYEEYGNNIDIRLVRDNPYSTYCVASESTNNNVELIDTKIQTTGNYCLQVRLTSSMLDPSGNSDLHYWISWRTY
ncbi:MAG: S8/S53 family peptidase [Ruminococcus sp.]|nr:S8/S53 family peptidase [Ruminococcus sp.]